jgi:hypothetical protein
MKKLVLALALISTPVLGQNTYVFGDSLSSPTECSWTNHLAGVVFNYAQAGLTLEAMDFPDHLKMSARSKAVVYIGTNDVGKGVHVDSYKQKLREVTFQLVNRGADVYLVAQPRLNVYIEQLNEYREATEQIAVDMSVNYIDPGWGAGATIDGVHPTCMAHFFLGAWFNQQLGY